MLRFRVLGSASQLGLSETFPALHSSGTAHITTMPLLPDVLQLHVTSWDWIGFPLAFYNCMRFAHAELVSGTLGEAWAILTRCMYVMEMYQYPVSYLFRTGVAWTPRAMAIGRILYDSNGMSKEDIIAAVLESSDYPLIVDQRRPRVVKFVTALAIVDVSAIPHDERCPVCEAAPEEWDHTIRKTPCGHLYGHDCLVEALAATADMLCPLCRQDMTVVGK
jgi:hypothetical protein